MTSEPQELKHIIRELDMIRSKIHEAITQVEAEIPASADMFYVVMKEFTIFYEDVLRNDKHVDDDYMNTLNNVACDYMKRYLILSHDQADNSI
jgi:hypothetical protein